MNLELILVTLLVGLGTYLIRFLPTFFMRGTGNPDAPLSRFLAATGPAAIAALYTGAVISSFAPDLKTIAPMLVGSLTVVAVYSWRKDVTVATLLGAVTYGIVFALL